MHTFEMASFSLPNDPHLKSTLSPSIMSDSHPRSHPIKSQSYSTESYLVS